jgi:D-glycero-D-manno-heptose 1,7-bisphosphate phosphatase
VTVARPPAARPGVFLDKDGTLIEDLPYNVDPGRIRLAPGAQAGIAALGAAGLPLVVVTNQSGVARGYFTEADLDAVHRHLAGVIEAAGAELAGFYYCPHLPEGVNEFAVECDCRKPLPGLIERAAADLGIDAARSWFIGDTWMDVVAGRAAGCTTILVGPDVRLIPELPRARRPDFAARDFLGAARIVLEHAEVAGKDARRREAGREAAPTHGAAAGAAPVEVAS